ncbi:CPBP family intramembrane glutamic endopeptidase [Teredinibacter haidensis]|uniref:CPBP family intramembrane glutamic endopeptidase n=1 Tax=Teredinibacter haidensis TaxID=2731755 RepID=UPI000948B654|nr:CPBP family intramembrane glutamic endopeptidase [Teredinibacter haidensis]
MKLRTLTKGTAEETILLATLGAVTLASVLFLFAGILALPVFGLVVLYTGSLLAYRHYTTTGASVKTFALWLIVVILGLLVGIYRPQNFDYPILFERLRLHENGLPYAHYINTAKLLAGYCTLIILYQTRSKHAATIKGNAKQGLLSVTFAGGILIVGHKLLGFEHHNKEASLIFLFGVSNLLVTCVSEEAFMRLLLQEQIGKYLSTLFRSSTANEVMALGIVTLLFAATHGAFTSDAGAVYMMAGFLYGLMYTLTRNIIVVVLLHFTVNIIHFSFFTYPLAL